MGRVRVETFLVTTDTIPAYGGFQMSEEMLRELAEGLRKEGTRMLAHHDERWPIDSKVLEVDVRETDSGSLGLWVALDVDEDEWRNSAPDARGMSISLQAWVVEKVDNPVVQLLADAGQFSDDDIEAAAAAMGSAGTVDWSRLYQFSEVAAAKVVIEFGVFALSQVPIGLLTSALYDGLKRLLRPRRADKPIFIFNVFGDDGKVVSARLETNSEDILRHALDRLFDHLSEGASPKGELLEFDEEHGDWE